MPLQNEKYLLMPCSGRARLGIPRGHIYAVMNRELEVLEFLTEQRANEKYGKAVCFISASDSLCPSCLDDILSKAK